jgi:hypothetical protein
MTPAARGLLVGIGAAVWFLSGVYSLTLISNTSLTELDEHALDLANARLLDPWILGGTLLFSLAAIFLERRLENTPEFPLGFLIGELSVLVTVALNCRVLLDGGETHWPIPPLVLVIAHLPFAVVEGVILGFVVGFLARVKPELLGIARRPTVDDIEMVAARPPARSDAIMVKETGITSRSPSRDEPKT